MNRLYNAYKNLKLSISLLFNGVRVDAAYSIVVVLVITAMFSTPLILGSIKNRVYVALKQQIEKENNAREITIQQANEDVRYNLDKSFLETLQAKYPEYRITGNHKQVVMIEGPRRSQVLTMQTLALNDPRTQGLQIKPNIPDNFELFDLIISDSLGKLLYGKEWDSLWSEDGTKFTGQPLILTYNDYRLTGEFRVVARQTAVGRKIYSSEHLGRLLARYSLGLGASKIGLPIEKELVPYSLPKFGTDKCELCFPEDQCDHEKQDKIVKRLEAENYGIQQQQTNMQGVDKFLVSMTRMIQREGNVEIKPTKADCSDRLSHHLEPCPGTTITPLISINPILEQQTADKLESIPVHIFGISSGAYDLLPGIDEMMNQQGGNKINFGVDGITTRGIEIVAPYGKGIELGALTIKLSENIYLPGFVTAYYKCSDSEECLFYATPIAVFRMQNVIDGSVTFSRGNPPAFLPVNPRIDYDEVLFYANSLEQVRPVFNELKKKLPEYGVEYQVYAIKKLERQDQRLATLFNLTVVLSIIFIIFAVGSLAKINIDRRRRQMAQLFILGYSKLFVSILLIFEYIILTIIASGMAIIVGSGVFAAARHYLQSSADQRSTDFTTIVESMTLDIGAFVNVFLIVLTLTILVAGYAAYYASKSDPVELLD
jgi:hypothetical protein